MTKPLTEAESRDFLRLVVEDLDMPDGVTLDDNSEPGKASKTIRINGVRAVTFWSTIYPSDRSASYVHANFMQRETQVWSMVRSILITAKVREKGMVDRAFSTLDKFASGAA